MEPMHSLRYIIRGGEKVLQYRIVEQCSAIDYSVSEWVDVPTEEEEVE